MRHEALEQKSVLWMVMSMRKRRTIGPKKASKKETPKEVEKRVRK